jgi:hypothetical protein
MKLNITWGEGRAIAKAVLAGALALGSSQLAVADTYPNCMCGDLDESFFCVAACSSHGLFCFCAACDGNCPPIGFWCTGACS